MPCPGEGHRGMEVAHDQDRMAHAEQNPDPAGGRLLWLPETLRNM